MPVPFVVAFVVGVTPSKWARIWAERMPRPLELRPLPQHAALAALRDGSAHVALLRLPVTDATLSAIPLYTELPVVVAPKDHGIEEFDAVSLGDLAGETMVPLPAVLQSGTHPHPADPSSLGDTRDFCEPDWAAAVELVAANTGVAVMPQSVARALSRRDVTARAVTDAPTTEIALVWVTARTIPETEEFVGIVRGRTANSSRGAAAQPSAAQARPARPKVVVRGRPSPKKRR